MEKLSLHRKHHILSARVLAFIGLTLASGPAFAAQQAPINWKAPMATITVTTAPLPNLQELERISIFGSKFLVVSASIPVPYSDLNLTQDAGTAELGRRINMAAHLACEQLYIKYPPNMYPVMGTDDCERKAADGGRADAGSVIAALQK